jgi:hypothetical protein
MLKRGFRILKFSTVEAQLGPLVARPSHDDAARGVVVGMDAEILKIRAESAQKNDFESIQAVLSLAFEIERDPYVWQIAQIPDAIRRAVAQRQSGDSSLV